MNSEKGSSPVVLYLLTRNTRKLEAWKHDLRRYRVEVRRADPEDNIEALLKGLDVLAVCREQSDLYELDGITPSARTDLEVVQNISTVEVFRLDADGVVARVSYRDVRKGYVDRSNGSKEDPDGWWDSIFRSFTSHLTYEEMQKQGILRSARDMVVSQFVLDRLHLPKKTSWQHSDVPRGDFGSSLSNLLCSNELLQKAWVKKHGILGVLQQVSNEGTFLRSAVGPRDRNYWCPPFSGIPFVSKADPIHELTYFVHDVGHQLLPDLVFDGCVTEHGRRLYLIHRMMSEAITLVLADMVFVDALNREGLTYDWSKRKVYPLFMDTGINLSGSKREEDLRALLWANVSYCVLGDRRPWLRLVGPEKPSLGQYETKYARFFMEDYRWTNQNWTNLAESAHRHREWWATACSLGDLRVQTVSEATLLYDEGLSTSALVGIIFDRVWGDRLHPVLFQEVAPVAIELSRQRAFRRWLAGQLGVFIQYRSVEGSKAFLGKILQYMKDNEEGLDLDGMQKVQRFYNEYIDTLLQRGVIDHDDAKTFKNVFPLFDPFYVFYDRQTQGTLEETARMILG